MEDNTFLDQETSAILSCINSRKFTILCTLIQFGRPVTMRSITDATGMIQETTIRALNSLEDCGLIDASPKPRTERQGRRVQYWATDLSRTMFDKPTQTLNKLWQQHDQQNNK